MKATVKKLIVCCILLSLILTGCADIDLQGYWDQLTGILTGSVSFQSIEYTRPDLVVLEANLENLCAMASTETDLDTLLDGIWNYYALYDDFSTSYALASIYYYQDLTNAKWEEEYAFCAEHSAAVDAGLDQLYRALAASPLRSQLESDEYFGPGYFDYYQGESIYDSVLLSLLEEETQLLSRYYAIQSQATDVDPYSQDFLNLYADDLTDVYLELIALRQEMADHLGYEDYVQFAYDFYYYRDYSPQQVTSYLADIRAQLVPLYTEHLQRDFWDTTLPASTEAETFAYLSSMAKNMGGQIEEAFRLLDKNDLYDISPGENKYNVSFEVYLPSYYVPFVFLSPLGNQFDHLTFAHEFGHFCSDYLSYGSIAGVDVAEIFSQGMEYLSLCYAQGGQELTALKLADCLCLYVEQAALASFEQQVYRLEGQELTAENVQQLYADICQAYGISDENWDARSYVTIAHYYTNPMYIISYLVSNDAALQLYQLELAQKGAGVAALESNLATGHAQLLAFLQDAGLSSPFDTGRLTQVKELLQQVLQSK